MLKCELDLELMVSFRVPTIVQVQLSAAASFQLHKVSVVARTRSFRLAGHSMSQDVESWNDLIMGHAQNGQGNVALQLYELMQVEGCIPTSGTYLAALRACICLAENEVVRRSLVKMDSLQKGTRIHVQLLRSELELDYDLENSLVEMYAKCGSLQDACEVFERMQLRTVTTWNTVLRGYAQNGKHHRTLQLYARMQGEGVAPNVHTLVAAGKACAVLAERKGASVSFVSSCLETCIGIHHQALQSRNAGDMFVGSTLVDMYAKCGSLEDAREVFERMPRRDSVSWSCIVNGYAQSAEAFRALELFSRMLLEGSLVPNASTYVGALKACACLADKEQVAEKAVKKRCLQRGRILHSQALACGHKLNNFLANSLIDMYAKCDSMVEAKKVFDEMQEPDVISWATIILGYARSGDEKQALELYSRMGLEVAPDDVVVSAVLKACASLAEKEQGTLVHGKLLKVESLGTGRGIHAEAVRHGHDRDMFVASKLVDMYSKCGSMTEAREVFDKMEKKDGVSWACIILGYAQNEQSEMALELYSRMQQEQDLSLPEHVTYVAALKACGDLGALETGRQIHQTIRSLGLESVRKISNSLMDFYSKCSRSMDEAEQVFYRMQARDVVAWNTLITGYGRQGQVDKAFELFEELLKQPDMEPNDVTFLSLLAACSHAGMVDRGKECFETMTSKHGVRPRVEHYSCMVDLLGRANLLEEALQMVKSMPMKPSESVWLALLSACRTWKNAALGRRAFEALVECGSRRPAAFVLMSKISEQDSFDTEFTDHSSEGSEPGIHSL